MKGGVSFDPVVDAYRAVVHTWDNRDCIGDPKEWLSGETFPTDDEAMVFYKKNIRPELEGLMRQAHEQEGVSVARRRLEE